MLRYKTVQWFNAIGDDEGFNFVSDHCGSLLVLLFQFLFQLTGAMTLHLGLVLVFAKSGGNLILVDVKRCFYNSNMKGLHHHSKEERYSQQIFHRMQK